MDLAGPPDPPSCIGRRNADALSGGIGDTAVVRDHTVLALPEAPLLRDGPGLILRRHRPQDSDGIYEQCQDPDMARFTTIPVPYGPTDADWFLEHAAAGWAAGTLAAFAIEVDGGFAGSIDLRLQQGSWAEVGFGLTPAVRGQGVMTRSLRLILDWGFSELALAGVQWRAVVGNHASLRVAQRCGFALEGSVRGLLVHRGQRLDGWIGTVLAADRPHPAR